MRKRITRRELRRFINRHFARHKACYAPYRNSIFDLKYVVRQPPYRGSK